MAANGIPGFWIFDPIGETEKDFAGEVADITVGLYPKSDDYTHGEFTISVRWVNSSGIFGRSDYLVFEVSETSGLRAFNDARIQPVVKKLAKWSENQRRFSVDDVRAILVNAGIAERGDRRRITVDA